MECDVLCLCALRVSEWVSACTNQSIRSHQNRRATPTKSILIARDTFLRWNSHDAVSAYWRVLVTFETNGKSQYNRFQVCCFRSNHTRAGDAINDVGIPFKSWNKIWFGRILFALLVLPLARRPPFLCDLIVTTPALSRHCEWLAFKLTIHKISSRTRLKLYMHARNVGKSCAIAILINVRDSQETTIRWR